MVAIGISGVYERILKVVFHPLIDDLIAFMGHVFVGILSPPFIKGPCVWEFIAEGPWACQVLCLKIFFFKRGKVFPVTIFIPESWDIGVCAHSRACKEQSTFCATD